MPSPRTITYLSATVLVFVALFIVILVGLQRQREGSDQRAADELRTRVLFTLTETVGAVHAQLPSPTLTARPTSLPPATLTPDIAQVVRLEWATPADPPIQLVADGRSTRDFTISAIDESLQGAQITFQTQGGGSVEPESLTLDGVSNPITATFIAGRSAGQVIIQTTITRTDGYTITDRSLQLEQIREILTFEGQCEDVQPRQPSPDTVNLADRQIPMRLQLTSDQGGAGTLLGQYLIRVQVLEGNGALVQDPTAVHELTNGERSQQILFGGRTTTRTLYYIPSLQEDRATVRATVLGIDYLAPFEVSFYDEDGAQSFAFFNYDEARRRKIWNWSLGDELSWLVFSTRNAHSIDVIPQEVRFYYEVLLSHQPQDAHLRLRGVLLPPGQVTNSNSTAAEYDGLIRVTTDVGFPTRVEAQPGNRGGLLRLYFQTDACEVEETLLGIPAAAVVDSRRIPQLVSVRAVDVRNAESQLYPITWRGGPLFPELYRLTAGTDELMLRAFVPVQFVNEAGTGLRSTTGDGIPIIGFPPANPDFDTYHRIQSNAASVEDVFFQIGRDNAFSDHVLVYILARERAP